MKIALLCPFYGEKTDTLDAFFAMRGLETLFAHHEVQKFSPFETDRDELLKKINRYDVIVFLGGLLEDGPSRWTAEDIRRLTKPVVPLALGMPGKYQEIRDTQTSALLQLLAKQGPLSAAEWFTQQWLAGQIDERSIQVTGCPSLFLETAPFRMREPRKVFCPVESDPGFIGNDARTLHRLTRAFYRRLTQSQRTLFLAHTSRELTFGAIPGNNTLHVPQYPILHLKALVSASAVVGFRPQQILAAVANRVPGVLLGNDRWAKSVAESAGIPFLEININTDAAELRHRVEDTLAKYPWERVSEKTSALRDNMVCYLKDRGISLKAANRVGRGATSMAKTSPKVAAKAAPISRGNLIQVDTGQPLNVCSISDSRYLPFFLGHVENLMAVHSGPIRFHLLALDKKAEAAARLLSGDLPITILTLPDLWNADELPRILPRDVGFRAFSSKPRLIAKTLQLTSGPVLYCDSDVFFHRSPFSLFEEFDTGNALVFPHWNDDATAARRDGLYNAGMVAVREGAENFLEWWSQLCLDRCEISASKGLVGDQGYLDFAPVYFDAVRVYRGADHNVAKWNLTTLGVEAAHEGEDGPHLRDMRPVQSFHAAFVDNSGFFEMKYGWDQIVHFFGNMKNAETIDPLYSNTLAQQKNHWMNLARFLNFHRALGDSFLPLAHKPKPSQVKFFIHGFGRGFLHAAVKLFTKGSTVPQGASAGFESFWVRLQRGRVYRATESSEISKLASTATQWMESTVSAG